MGEANLPAQDPQASQEPRVSPPNGDPGRASHRASPAAQGPPAPVGLIEPISDRATFLSLRRSGRRVRQGPLTVTFLPEGAVGPCRVAYSVSRRVGGAVQRNRLRRRLRAAVSEAGSQLRPGAYLMGAAPEAASLSFEELKAVVATLLERTGNEGRS